MQISYTPEHFSLMEILEDGLVWRFHRGNDRDDDLLRFLLSQGVVMADVRKCEDYYTLTEYGRSLLAQHRKEKAEQARKQSEDQFAEAVRLEERRQDRADAERRHSSQNRTTVLASALSAVLGFILGILAEHGTGIVGWFLGLFH